MQTDHLDTPRQLTDTTKKMVWNWAYSAFGENQPTTTNNTVFNLRYPGQYYDAESKLHYNINRYYDAATGRYTQSDPIGLSGGINTYTYVGGNTVRWSDRAGLVVSVCKRPINIGWIPKYLSNVMPYHHWLKTDSEESGMGAECAVPGQGCSDRPLDKTYTKPHNGQSKTPNTSCKVIPNIDEQCVNALIKPGQSTGRWTPLNQCQSFVGEVLNKCSLIKNIDPVIYPHLTVM